ncbi:hypothetical protein [Gordonia alkaliphila]|uniref:hypothetical protein n=1 Tax=Gordonia alkaliphila TaxID=1053547 RepID=UPI0031EBC00A
MTARFAKGHGKAIMKGPEMQRVLNGVAARLDRNLAAAGGRYETIVEDGGDRLRAAAWTRDHAAKRETAADGTLLNALNAAGE